MLRLICCEFSKLKRKKLFFFAYLTTFILPLSYAFISAKRNLESELSVVRGESGYLLLIPLSVIVAANLFFEEHDYDTLKNLVCIPVSKVQLAVAKVFVLLIFDIGYMMTGYAVAILMSVVSGEALVDWKFQLCLTFGTGILLWAAAMPCLLLVVWCNKSYIISVIIAFAYTVLEYIPRLSDFAMRVPLGLNIPTFMPVPMIERWLYQYYYTGEGAGELFLEFYESFQPYFVSTPVIFSILLTEAAICMALLTRIYQKQTS